MVAVSYRFRWERWGLGDEAMIKAAYSSPFLMSELAQVTLCEPINHLPPGGVEGQPELDRTLGRSCGVWRIGDTLSVLSASIPMSYISKWELGCRASPALPIEVLTHRSALYGCAALHSKVYI